jgi:hypothetical protein
MSKLVFRLSDRDRHSYPDLILTIRRKSELIMLFESFARAVTRRPNPGSPPRNPVRYRAIAVHGYLTDPDRDRKKGKFLSVV